jgi:hypothetical protein
VLFLTKKTGWATFTAIRLQTNQVILLLRDKTLSESFRF